MPTLTIDKREVTVPDGTNVIKAAKQLGISIPHYCYHAGLSVAGSCRMCMVEVEGIPKLQIGCYTFARDGMVVRTDTDKVRTARSAMLEFLLKNHPLDCPVCDQAGECKLQKYYMSVGLHESRLLENKLKKHKALPIGPHVMLDSERCILCTRCVRFCREVSKTNELHVFQRGSFSELLPIHDKAVDNPYSGNLNDICPVGALTDRDFRFKNRVWYLKPMPTVCAGCARGCSVWADTNRQRRHHNDGRMIARLRARGNQAVNGHWICDDGRYSFKPVETESRLMAPAIRTDGKLATAPWGAALDRAATLLQEAVETHGADDCAVLALPTLSNEELLATRHLFGEQLKIKRVACRFPADPCGVEDELLRKADTFPNTFGAEHILGDGPAAESVMDDCSSGRVKCLVILGGDPARRLGGDKLVDVVRLVPSVVYVGPYRTPLAEAATVALPMTTNFESDGSFTNFAGHVQRFTAAIPPVWESKWSVEILDALATMLNITAPPVVAEELFDRLAATVGHFKGLTYERLGTLGLNPSRAVEKPEPQAA